MSNKMVPLFLLCESPLHVGIGSDVGIVDMPIQRERHTNWPKIEASGIKGSIRESFERKYGGEDNKIIDINLAFGYDANGLDDKIKAKIKNREYAGALGFTDARILLFPVKSMKGIFVWITCPALLGRFFKDFKIAGVTDFDPNFLRMEKDCLSPGAGCKIEYEKGFKVILEEFTLHGLEAKESCSKLGEWLSKNILPKDEVYSSLEEKMKKDVIILSDDMFGEFVSHSTEVITRTKIDNKTGTVKGAALFTEEYLPAETIMYTFAIASPLFGIAEKGESGNSVFKSGDSAEVIKFFKEGLNPVIQIGGNATIGKGIVSTRLLEEV